MTGGSQANRDGGRGGNYGGSRGSSGAGGGSSGGERTATHTSGAKGRITNVEKTSGGDTIIEITKDDGTTHRDYDTYFSRE